jgi:segregation and condensation protein B
MNNLIAKLEALLFLHGEPISIKKASQILKVKEEELDQIIQQLDQLLNQDNRGLCLLNNNKSLQLITKPDLSDLAKQLIKQDLQNDLTPAALEAISIIAYSGPISREELEYIRGVNCTFILRSLLVRGLVNKQDNQYQVSFDLLKHLGLSNVNQLPEYEKYQMIKQKLRTNETPS